MRPETGGRLQATTGGQRGRDIAQRVMHQIAERAIDVGHRRQPRTVILGCRAAAGHALLHALPLAIVGMRSRHRVDEGSSVW